MLQKNECLSSNDADDLALFGVGRKQPIVEVSPSLSTYVPSGTFGTVIWTSRHKHIVSSLVRPGRRSHLVRMTENENVTLFEAIRGLEG
jgi:hypothetical protein